MRLDMLSFKQILSILFIISLTADVTWSDKTTAEKIRKHQEWLKQRNRGRSHNGLATRNNQSRKSLDHFNLWRFDRQQSQAENDPSINDVYPENERILKPKITTTSTTTTTKTTSTTTTTPRPRPRPRQKPTTLTSTTTPTITTTPKPTTTTTQSPATIATIAATTATTIRLPTTTAAATRYSLSFTQRPPAADWLGNEVLYITTPLAPIAATTAATTTSTTTAAPIIAKATTTTTTKKPATIATSTTTTTTTTTTTRKPRTRPYPRWNDWSNWSDCSRSCGGGVRYQTRKCINK